MSGDYGLEGWVLGGQLGYNWQVDSIVFGLEGDLSVTSVSGSSAFTTRDIDWMASLRGRVGYAIDGLLLYGTAGVALGKSTSTLIFNGTDSETHVGWTAGVGAEFLVTDNVSIRGEYRYTDLGAKTYTYGFVESDTAITAHTATVGVNFHF